MESMGKTGNIEGIVMGSTGIKKRINGLNRMLGSIRTESSMIKPERSNELHPGFLSLALIIVNF